MANEITILEYLGDAGDVVFYNCVDNVAITKGTLLELEDERTAKKVSGAGVVIAGIANADKVADDGATKIGVVQNCIALMTCGAAGTATLGSHVRSAGSDNTITVATTLDNETGKSAGKSLATGGNNEEIQVRVNL